MHVYNYPNIQSKTLHADAIDNNEQKGWRGFMCLNVEIPTRINNKTITISENRDLGNPLDEGNMGHAHLDNRQSRPVLEGFWSCVRSTWMSLFGKNTS